jgi:hypothetical protein
MRRAILVALGLLLAAATGAVAEPRLALVVGNSAYERLGALRNPGNDAKLVASMLQQVGFKVTTATDVTRADFLRAVRTFAGQIEEAGRDTVAVLFFAGHGIQFRGDNYLIPVRSDLRTQRDLPIEAIRVDDILRTIEEARPRMTFIVLDACRDNPLPAGPSGTRSAKRGLAAVVESPGVIIAFSTGPNSTAKDGDADHSPYSRALAEAIPLPGIEVEQMFKKVRVAVSEATNGEQIPWENSKLTSTFYFVPPTAASPTAPPPATARAPEIAAPPSATTAQDPTVAYHQAVQKDTLEAYHEVLARFPNHPKRDLLDRLMQRKNEERLLAEADAAKTPAEESRALQRLLIAYPDGVYGERARERLTYLSRTSVPPSQSASAPAVSPPTLESEPPPAAEQVRRFHDFDAPGNDLFQFGGADLDTCERACVQDRTCAVYTLNRDAAVCFLKATSGQLTAFSGATTGVVAGRGQMPRQPALGSVSLSRLDEMDLQGFDYRDQRDIDLSDCERGCAADARCRAFSWIRAKRWCWLKDNVSGPRRAIGVISGIKR